MCEIARIGLVCAVLAACGSSPPPAPPAPPAPPPGPSAAELAAQRAAAEQAQHDAAVAAHRKLEEQQQDALAATCSEPPHADHARCLPSCYPTEPADPRAGKKLSGQIQIEHLVCQAGDTFLLADELAAGKLHARGVRGHPAPHRKGSWQAEIEAWLAGAHPARGDAFVVAGSWRELVHPLTHEKLRCVAASHYVRAMRGALERCGVRGDVACEAAGDPAARAINVVHYRLAEARALAAAGKNDDCQQAALEAIAVARGLPRWRQYAKLNVGTWTAHAAYRTRFDGTLDEDALFAAAASQGSEAEQVYARCGGAAGAPTTPEQEQSFHTCW
ncbi:MAG TPA: hypothetical protein VLX92_10500 [Kofleriaceae bacterium]|nr:hypothetical protein [Kofleriaceae bacterium]